MKAAIIDRYGVLRFWRYDNVDKPAINPDQLLVKVYASSVNPIDWKIRQGMLKFLTGSKFPLILGFDVRWRSGKWAISHLATSMPD